MESILAEPMRSEATPITERDFVPLFGQIAIGKPRVLRCPPSFAAEYDLSAALTELRVAIRLRGGRSRKEDCSRRPTHINIISIAAMHTPFPRWVMNRRAASPQARQKYP
jgi:hypothetical protein